MSLWINPCPWRKQTEGKICLMILVRSEALNLVCLSLVEHVVERARFEKLTCDLQWIIEQSNWMSDRRAHLLREKMIANARISHNNAQYRLEQLVEEQEQAHKGFRQRLADFAAGIDVVVRQYQNSMLELSRQSPAGYEDKLNILQAGQIKKYLNAQKNALKEMVEKAEEGEVSSQEDKVHYLLRRNALHTCLEEIGRKQLQDQIRYLSEHVITSSGVIYVPDQHMTQAEEDTINSKIRALTEQVERLIGLEVICEVAGEGVRDADPCALTLKALNLQSQRLMAVDKILTQEREQVSKLQRWANTFDCFLSEIPALPSPQQHRNPASSSSLNCKTINLQQLELINEKLSPPDGNIVENRTCHHDELTMGLRKLMQRIR